MAATWRCLTLLVVVLVGVTGCSVFGDDEEDPPAELVKFDATLKIRKAWSAGVGDDSEALSLALAPASDGSRVYAASYDGRVRAFEAVKGKRQWQAKTGRQLSAGPETDGEVVVVGSSNGNLLLLSADNGKLIWEVSLSSEVLAAPAVTRSRIFVRTVDGKLTALDRDDGRMLWFVQQSVPRLSVRGTGAPVIVGDAVVCGFDNGRIAAYQASDGSELWDTLLAPPAGRNEVERLADINATVRAVGSDLYVVSYQGMVAQVAMENGQVLWSQEVAGHTGIGADVGSVYVATTDSLLLAFDRGTGRELWRTDILKNRAITGPTAWENSVVVGDFEGYLHVFDARTGDLQARVRVDDERITSAPIVVGELLYALSDTARLAAYRQAAR